MPFNVIDYIYEKSNRVLFKTIDPNTHSVYVIGDIHGCYDEMVGLVTICKDHAITMGLEPKIIFLGDLIDRGPEFMKIFEFITENDIECVLGNHELNFYLEHKKVIECRSKARRVNHDTFNDYGDETKNKIIDIIGNMPNAIFIKFPEVVGDSSIRIFTLTHSPMRNVENIMKEVEMTGPVCSMRPDEISIKDLERNFHGVMMLHGHQSWNFKPVSEQLEEQKSFKNRVINIDSGCVYGDALTAFCLNTKETLDVPAKEVYHERQNN